MAAPTASHPKYAIEATAPAESYPEYPEEAEAPAESYPEYTEKTSVAIESYPEFADSANRIDNYSVVLGDDEKIKISNIFSEAIFWKSHPEYAEEAEAPTESYLEYAEEAEEAPAESYPDYAESMNRIDEYSVVLGADEKITVPGIPGETQSLDR